MATIIHFIVTGKPSVVWCMDHDKVWREAAEFESKGGAACEACCTNKDRKDRIVKADKVST